MSRPPLPLLALRALVALALEAALLAWGLGGRDALAASPRALALLAIWGVTGLTLSITRPVRSQETVRAERDPRGRDFRIGVHQRFRGSVITTDGALARTGRR